MNMERCLLLPPSKARDLELNVTEKHFFKDCDEIFTVKQDIFVDDYLDQCILAGDALNYTPLAEVDLTFNADFYEDVYYLRLINALLDSKPMIHVESDSLYESKQIFDIYYINNFEDIEDFYCIRSTYDFLVEGVMIYQIYEVKIKSLDMLNEFWITYE
jgi:hypothetical protein